jgi:hypothetical protein
MPAVNCCGRGRLLGHACIQLMADYTLPSVPAAAAVYRHQVFDVELSLHVWSGGRMLCSLVQLSTAAVQLCQPAGTASVSKVWCKNDLTAAADLSAPDRSVTLRTIPDRLEICAACRPCCGRVCVHVLQHCAVKALLLRRGMHRTVSDFCA